MPKQKEPVKLLSIKDLMLITGFGYRKALGLTKPGRPLHAAAGVFDGELRVSAPAVAAWQSRCFFCENPEK